MVGDLEVGHLRKHLRGEEAYEPPIYTVDDTTGDLIDPTVSIYIRGTDNPEANDVRTMAESHFMGDMAEVRTALAARAEPVLVGAGAVDNDGDVVDRSNASDPDERHLNQYLA